MSVKPTTPEAYELFHRGSLVLSRIEEAGVRVDRTYLDSSIDSMEKKIKKLEIEMREDKEVYGAWRRRYGQRVNLGSREQLAHVLFKCLGFKSTEVTATGRVKVDKSVLDKVDHPFVKKFLKCENHKKSLSTYLTGIRRETVQHADGNHYVHPFYNLHTAVSNRSSCNDPNYQNQPIRDPEMAALIRKCYLPHPGHYYVEIDFEQLEVKVAACYNKDPTLLKYIFDPTTDMHRDTAAELFYFTPDFLVQNKDWAKKGVRDWAKNRFVFPEFYGSVHFNCAVDLWEAVANKNPSVPGTKIAYYDLVSKKRKFREKNLLEHLAEHGIHSLGECDVEKMKRAGGTKKGTFVHRVKEVENSFWHSRFKVYTEWKQQWWKKYLKNAGFQMLTGFSVNGEYKKNDVINYPVQGSAFHCLLWCLIQIDNWLRKNKMKSRLIGEIHDSLNASVHPAELQDFLSYCKHVMTVLLPKHWDWIIVPMGIEVEVSPQGESWYAKKVWVQKDNLWSLKV